MLGSNVPTVQGAKFNFFVLLKISLSNQAYSHTYTQRAGASFAVASTHGKLCAAPPTRAASPVSFGGVGGSNYCVG